jgi:hypothetical protein
MVTCCVLSEDILGAGCAFVRTRQGFRFQPEAVEDLGQEGHLALTAQQECLGDGFGDVHPAPCGEFVKDHHPEREVSRRRT